MTGELRTFLDLDETDDPLILLGFASMPTSAAEVQAALRDRLGRVFAHPAGRSEAALEVRRRLRLAAGQLVARLGRSAGAGTSAAAAQSAHLTPFDRAVLAVLVGSGGWNAQSRSRLIGLAARYAVTPDGLVRVIAGLSEVARRGGSRVDIRQITSGLPIPDSGAATRAEPPTGVAIVRRLAPELTDSSFASRMKLSLFFGVLTIALGVVAFRVLLHNQELVVRPQAPDYLTAPAPSASDIGPRAPAAASAPAAPLTFERYPTFLGHGLPAEAAAAADLAPQLLERLDLIARKLAVSDDPSEAVFRDWNDALPRLAAGWLLVDETTRRTTRARLLDVLLASADNEAVTRRLLEAVDPSFEAVVEPIDLWRGSWYAGVLGVVAENTSVPAATSQLARESLARALGQDDAVGAGFQEASERWLDRVIPRLVRESDRELVYDFWELWLSAQRRLRRSPELERTAAAVVVEIVATPSTRIEEAPALNVLGRMAEAALASRDPEVRDVILSVYGREGVSSRRLWVLSSVLHAGPARRWMPSDLVVGPEADLPLRRRLRDRVAQAWPVEERQQELAAIDHGVRVDATRGEAWRALAEEVLSQPSSPEPAVMAEQLLVACRLNQAALLLVAQSPDEAERALQEARQALGSGRADPTNLSPQVPMRELPPRRGQSLGEDGAWAAAYREVTVAEDRLALLRSLRTSAGTDLGAVDAAIVVREAYRGTPEEVRSLARALVTERFSAGAQVGLQLLDQFPDAPKNRATWALIQRVTGEVLVDAADAESVARLALVESVLERRSSHRDRIDGTSAEVFACYDDQARRVDQTGHASSAALRAHESASLLAELLRRDAAAMIANVPVPDTLEALQRRHRTRLSLASGPLQMFVASQIEVLETLAFITAAEQPGRRESVLELLDASFARRQAASHVLEQALETERAISRLWRLRMKLPERSALRLPLGGSAELAAMLAVTAQVSIDDRVAGRLESLHPTDPMAYFELAEELADAGDPQARELARRLFALAGLLDPTRLGRSAALALADLAETRRVRRQMLALASMLGGAGVEARLLAPVPDETGLHRWSTSAVLALGEAFSHHRQGLGNRAIGALRRGEAMRLLEELDAVVPGGANGFLEDCRLYRGDRRPNLSESDLDRFLRLELGLLAGDSRPWSSDLLLQRGDPLVEVDPSDLESVFGVDAAQPLYRAGRWVRTEE